MKQVLEKRSSRVFACAIGFRIFVYFCSVIIMCLFGDYQKPLEMNDFLDAWSRWDTVNYINISEVGYEGAIENGQHLFLVFYPLYPWLIRTLNLFVHNSRIAAMMISTVCFAIGCVYLDKITTLEFDRRCATKTMMLQAVFPFGFFFGAIMTESLFFALSAMFFYYLRKHRFFEVAFVGFLACLTRNQGVLLIIAVIAELFESGQLLKRMKGNDWKGIFTEIIWPGIKCMPMIGGTLVYMVINYMIEGDPFRFLYYQKKHWGNRLVPIWDTLKYVSSYTAQKWYTPEGMALWVPEFVLIFIYIAVIAYGIKIKISAAYLWNLIAYFLLTYSSSWLISGARYTLCAVPLFMITGQFITKHERIGKILIGLSWTLMIIYMTGYYQWKQIM